MPLIPGSLVAGRSTASASARLILSSAAANRADPDESPRNSLGIVARFFFFFFEKLLAVAFQWLGMARGGLLWLFWARGGSAFCLRCQSKAIFTTRAF